jgi:hypothetical protein
MPLYRKGLRALIVALAATLAFALMPALAAADGSPYLAVVSYADDADPVAVGDTITYATVVTNLSGTNTATGVNLHFEFFWDTGDDPPPGVTSAVSSHGACVVTSLPRSAPPDPPPLRVVDCPIGDLAPGPTPVPPSRS